MLPYVTLRAEHPGGVGVWVTLPWIYIVVEVPGVSVIVFVVVPPNVCEIPRFVIVMPCVIGPGLMVGVGVGVGVTVGVAIGALVTKGGIVGMLVGVGVGPKKNGFVFGIPKPAPDLNSNRSVRIMIAIIPMMIAIAVPHGEPCVSGNCSVGLVIGSFIWSS